MKLKTIFISLIFTFLLFSPVFAANEGINYRAHVADKGWLSEVSNGSTAGTTGENRRLEALKIYLTNCPSDSHVEYQAHVADIGWQNYTLDNNIGGTTGKAKAMEAIKIRLKGPVSTTHDVYYRTHVQDYGWLGWAKNDQVSGSTGYAKKMEAIEIVLVPKGSNPPGSTDRPSVEKGGGTSSHGKLSVQGSNLVDQSGARVQLRGVSTHGLAWYPQYVNQNLVNELKNQWGANVLRLAMYTSESGGYCTDGNKENLKNLVRNGVSYATKAGMYVIIDWHVLNDQDPNQYKSEAKDFFNQMAAEFKDYDNVLYEICNEPNGSATWAGIKSYANEVIPVIRSHDNDAVIIVGTPTWSQRVDEALQDPITGYSNIMYALHFYAGTHKDDLRAHMEDAVNHGLPIFVSEFGITDASGNGNLDVNSANQWVSSMNRLGISYVCWNLSNKNESSALIRSDITKTSGFSHSELSGEGQWLLGVLGSPGLTENTPDTPANPSPEQPSESKPTYQLELKNSWVSGEKTYYQYSLTVNNNSSAQLTDWSATVDFNQSLSIDNSWNGTFSLTGSTLTITPVDYNKTVAPNSSLSDIGFIVVSDSGLSATVK